jgi:hypothetical protein
VDRTYQHLLHLLKEIYKNNIVLGRMAEDQNLNVPGVDHQSQGNNDEGIFALM